MGTTDTTRLQEESNPLTGRLSLRRQWVSFIFFFLGTLLPLFIVGWGVSVAQAMVGTNVLWVQLFSLLYSVLIVPALSYHLLRWFFLHTEFHMTPVAPLLDEGGEWIREHGKLRLGKKFPSFLRAYFLSFGVLLVTLGLGFPYYVYEQKAWFFRNNLIEFPSKQMAVMSLRHSFREYFLKSWGILLLSAALIVMIPLVVIPFLNERFLLLGGVSSFMIGVISFIFVLVYYFYWSWKWLLAHTHLTFLPLSALPAVPPEVVRKGGLYHSTHRFYFKGHFLQFFLNSVLFLIISLFTLGVGVVFYLYWLGTWYINHTELHAIAPRDKATDPSSSLANAPKNTPVISALFI